MKIFPAKDNFRRTEQELRLQPFTLLTAIPVTLIVAAGFTYTCVYSDDEGAVIRHALLSLCLAIPAIILFAVVWKKEAKRPFSLRVRRIVWRVMLCGFLAVIGGALVLFYRTHGLRRYGLLTFIGLSGPMAYALFSLNRSSKKNG